MELTSILSAIKTIDRQNGKTFYPDNITNSQMRWGCILFSFLFFMWGLAYGLLDIMNYHIKVIMGVSRGEAARLALAYYFAYPVGGLLVGGPLVKKCGYRFSAVFGLAILAAGMEFMSLGASNLSLTGMCLAHFVVGIGVSTLERTANPYATNVGSRSSAPTRILFTQTWAAIGTVIAPLLANKVIFDPTTNSLKPAADPLNPGKCLLPAPSKADTNALSSVVTFYRALGGVVFGLSALLAVVFFLTKLVVEVEVPTSPVTKHKKWQIWKFELLKPQYGRLQFAAVVNFINLGCQVTVAQFFMEHVRVNACQSQKAAAEDFMIAQTLFVFGRIAAFLFTLPFWRRYKFTAYLFKSRHVLMAFIAGAVAFTGAGIGDGGKLAIICICLVMFFEAPSFPMIFESATAGFEEWTAKAESIMITSIMGGGLMPILTGLLVDRVGPSVGWALPTAGFAVVWTYTITCNLSPSYKKALDTSHGELSSVSDEESNPVEMRGRSESRGTGWSIAKEQKKEVVVTDVRERDGSNSTLREDI